ncbi:hypothetical protein LMQ56_004479, partial [Salmonella enterica]|nr:hypothetical protein [Salmonella enterica]
MGFYRWYVFFSLIFFSTSSFARFIDGYYTKDTFEHLISGFDSYYSQNYIYVGDVSGTFTSAFGQQGGVGFNFTYSNLDGYFYLLISYKGLYNFENRYGIYTGKWRKYQIIKPVFSSVSTSSKSCLSGSYFKNIDYLLGDAFFVSVPNPDDPTITQSVQALKIQGCTYLVDYNNCPDDTGDTETSNAVCEAQQLTLMASDSEDTDKPPTDGDDSGGDS